MATFISHSSKETASLGEEWGRAAQRGLVIGLTGGLGAGKTQLVKGIARGLEVASRVHSPTFTLVNEYGGGRLKLFHLDLYRLDSQAQILGAGLEEFLQPDGVTVIEWAERWIVELPKYPNIPMPNFPGLYRSVRIEVLNESERRITYEDFGG